METLRSLHQLARQERSELVRISLGQRRPKRAPGRRTSENNVLLASEATQPLSAVAEREVRSIVWEGARSVP